jgi:hypothetical protein
MFNHVDYIFQYGRINFSLTPTVYEYITTLITMGGYISNIMHDAKFISSSEVYYTGGTRTIS